MKFPNVYLQQLAEYKVEFRFEKKLDFFLTFLFSLHVIKLSGQKEIISLNILSSINCSMLIASTKVFCDRYDICLSNFSMQEIGIKLQLIQWIQSLYFTKVEELDASYMYTLYAQMMFPSIICALSLTSLFSD